MLPLLTAAGELRSASETPQLMTPLTIVITSKAEIHRFMAAPPFA
jgi:hypothetical protein